MIVAACVGQIELPKRLVLKEEVHSFCKECILFHYTSNPGMIFIDQVRPIELKELPMWYGDPLNKELCLDRRRITAGIVRGVISLLDDLSYVLSGLINVERQILMVKIQRKTLTKIYNIARSLPKDKLAEIIGTIKNEI